MILNDNERKSLARVIALVASRSGASVESRRVLRLIRQRRATLSIAKATRQLTAVMIEEAREISALAT